MGLLPDKHRILNALQFGNINLHGQFLNSSNYTFLVEIDLDDFHHKAVYKPIRGESPLWDFPPKTLAKRETAAYELSEALGWDLVPPTVFRTKKMPLGPGSLQLYIEHDPTNHFFQLSDSHRIRLQPAVIFDLLANNADRKGGHILLDHHDHIWLIDHGVCFHVEDKLRTVIWDFSSQPIPADLLKDIDNLVIDLNSRAFAYNQLSPLLNNHEIMAIRDRGHHLVGTGLFPSPQTTRRPFPWPPI
jgi:hypothetical protein